MEFPRDERSQGRVGALTGPDDIADVLSHVADA